MLNDARMPELMQAVADIIGRPVADETLSLAALGIDSRDLVSLIVACEQIYGAEFDITAIGIDHDTTLAELHQALLAYLGA
jgi:acyl carrier protein